MKKEILANIMPEETRIAVLEDGKLVELLIERPALGMAKLVGNIYKGKVENVLPGISSAFVSTGFEKNAYLYVTDVVSDAKVRHIEKMIQRRKEVIFGMKNDTHFGTLHKIGIGGIYVCIYRTLQIGSVAILINPVPRYFRLGQNFITLHDVHARLVAYFQS